MEAVTLLGLLGICTMEDIQEKQIHMAILSFFGAVGVICHIIHPSRSIQDLLGGMAVGGGLWIISLISRERIGQGDAFLIMVTGIYLGFWQNFIVLWGATLLAGVFGVILLLFFKKERSTEIPFAPFVLLSYVISLLAGGLL